MTELFFNFCRTGDVFGVDIILKNRVVDPGANNNQGIIEAAYYGHLAVVEQLLQDYRVDPAANRNCAFQFSPFQGHIAVVERLLQDPRVDPSTDDNYAVRCAAARGHFAVVNRIMQDKRADSSTRDNHAIKEAAQNGHLKIVDRLLDDRRNSFASVSAILSKEQLGYFEYRERLTEICIAMQDLNLPAWITMIILKASYPWTTLSIHKRWKLVCTVKHFRDTTVDA